MAFGTPKAMTNATGWLGTTNEPPHLESTFGRPRVNNSIREQELTDLFRRYEVGNAIVRVRFSDGECYDLRVNSTMHADAGGDIVATVIQSINSDNPDRWKKAAMNFKLENVVRVEVDGECVFDIQHRA